MAVLFLMMLVTGCGSEPVVTSLPQGEHASACERAKGIDRTRFDAANRDQLVTMLLCWLEENTEHKNLRPPRGLVEADIRVIWDLGSRGGTPMYRAEALFSCRESTVYLVKGRDFSQLGPQSTLVHELVHHAQCLKRPPTIGERCEREREAYTIQAKYIRYIGDTVPRSEEQKAALINAAEQVERNIERVCAVFRGEMPPTRPAQPLNAR